MGRHPKSPLTQVAGLPVIAGLGVFFLAETSKEWYSNKDLFEMIRQLKDRMDELSNELARTTTLIRDYNSLRTNLHDMEKRISNIEGKDQAEDQTKRDYVGWIFGIVMLIIAVLPYLKG